MPCEWLKAPDGTVIHLNRARGGRRHLCKFCNQKYGEGKACDYPLGNGKTCDAEMCSNCAVTLGYQNTDIGSGMKRLGDTIDLCPLHRDKAVVRGGELILR